MYISENLRYKRRYDIEVNDVESIWLELFNSNNNSILVNFLYRPPNSNQSWIDLYESQLDRADSTNLDLYILGDFNINYMPGKTVHNFNNSKWKDITTKFGLIQHINNPTRSTKRSSTIIDHIYTSCSYTEINAFVSRLSISDHYPVCFTYPKMKRSKDNSHQIIKYRSFKNFDENTFRETLFYSGLDCTETFSDPNKSLDVFYNCVNFALKKHAPVKEKRIKHDHQPAWYSNEIKALIRERDYCKRKGDHGRYKLLRNQITSLIKKSKRDFFNKAINENKDAKFMWKNLKDMANLNHTGNIALPSKLTKDNEELEDKLSIVNELNYHFVSISNIITKMKFEESNFTLIKTTLNSILRNNIFDIDFITMFEVRKIINKLDVNKSTGVDGIGPAVLKYCGDIIIPSITYIINSSISTGIFPDKLKEARVLPIFKGGCNDKTENYRPISILPTISKIFERHIADQIHKYLDKTNVLHKTQSGFRKHHSTLTALTRLIDAWINDIDSGKLVGTVFLDLRKAFDLVDHDILIYKLKLYHFSEKSINLFKSYLSNRQQSVVVGNVQSNKLVMQSGVPQGSILGPLLFLLYINDMTFSCNDLNIDLYADDSTMFQSGFKILDIQTRLQKNLDEIDKWCTLNNMALHPKKTKCMVIGSRYMLQHSNQLSLKIGDTVLENVTEQKILGVYIDNMLNWHVQIDYVCKKINSKISLLKRILYLLSDDMKMLFYNSYILPVFDYCCIIWGKDNKSYINKVHKLQKRIAKIILNKPLRSPTIGLYRELNWLSFSDRCKYNIAVLVYKTINNLAPSYLLELLSFSQNDKYCLRSSNHHDLVLMKRPRTNLFKDSFNYYSAKIWNTIPVSIRNSSSISMFKNSYKSFLLSMNK